MSEVLLLNADHSPLRILKLARAVVLVLDGHAEILEANGEIHSPSITLPRPSVIRLTRWVQIPWKAKVPLNRKTLSIRDNGECQVSGCTRAGTTIDHVKPRSRGGRHEWMNVALMCRHCNAEKGDKLLSELGWTLKSEPHVPRRMLILGITEAKHESWTSHLAAGTV